jgi:aryl-alcohol dehydrogenase-like predicted oxidoreductase
MPRDMCYRLLGPSGLRVSELALGTMTFGTEWGAGGDAAQSRRMFDAYAARGGNFIDTANRYTEGTSERLVGEFIASDRDHFVLATKYTLFDRKGDPNFSGNHRKNLVRSVTGSLQRLGTDYLDLLWVHMWDFTTTAEEVMRALDDLVRQGRVHHVGISDTPAWVIAGANTLAQLRGWSPFVAVQLRYSLIDRAGERDLLPMARAFGLAVTPWSVLGAGVLSGKYNKDRNAKGRAAQGAARNEKNLQIAAVAGEIAAALGATPSQVAIAWAMSRPGVMIPLLGARNVAQLEDNLGALDVRPTPEHLSRLDEASAIDLGFPHEFLRQPAIQDLVFGGTQGRLEREPRR